MEGIIYIDDFVSDPDDLKTGLENDIIWDDKMASRKTASYGVAYNYSQMSYPFQEMLPALKSLCLKIDTEIGFLPNNCLINYYADGKAKMGFHADQTDILAPDTGVAIISLGETRTLRFRNTFDKTMTTDYELKPGSLFYMTQTIQHHWEHSVIKSDTDLVRISLTFRNIVA